VQLLVAGTLVLRMRQMQLADADQYRLLAEENRINIRLLPPSRGLILDRNGVVLADNEQNYRIVLVREDAGDPRAALEHLAQLIPLGEADIERAMREIMRHRPFVPVTIADRLSWEELARVAANAPALPGITPEVGLSRHYRFGPEFAHAVGYVGPVSEADLAARENPEPLLLIPRFQIGKVGIERELEESLRGSAGHRRIEVNAVGREMRELDRQEGVAGQNVQLTLDRNLQAFAAARLDGESAAAVLMEISTGNVLALASSPSFDPNLFVRGISVNDFSALRENEHRPMSNKTVQGAYPPGSTFKMVTALAAFEAGLVATPDERVFCPGHMEVAGHGGFTAGNVAGMAGLAWFRRCLKAVTCISTSWPSAAASTASTPCRKGWGWGGATICRFRPSRPGSTPRANGSASGGARNGWWATPSTPPSGRASCCPRRCNWR
jgi:penicillin-binding protein 2